MKNLLRISGLILSIFLISSCKKEEKPTLTTSAISTITATTATSGGTITDEGSSTVISRGVCWSTGTSPTIADSKTTDGAGAGSFSSNISGIYGGTDYYVRAYATNSIGTGYGMAMSFTTTGEPPSAPIATATNATQVQLNSATLNGIVNAKYHSTSVTFEYGTTTGYGSTATPPQSPITGNTSSNVSADITGLTSGTIYHYRIKAVNSLGTTFSDDMTFITLTIVKGTVTDIDGNVYKTITLMKKTHTNEDKLYPVGTWMAENLKTTKYSNGELIGTTVPVTLNISNNSVASYQWPVGNNESNVATYGRLYTWYVASDNRNVCPTGWHVSTLGEWIGLNNFMVVKYDNSRTSSDNGSRLKEVGTTHWPSPNIDATDEIGFTALPTGSRNKLGASNITEHAYWWVNDYGWVYNLDYSTNLFFSWMNTPLSGFSIRCVKD